MSARTDSCTFDATSENTAIAPLLADNDDRSSVDQRTVPITALAIEAHNGRLGFSVFLEEEHQLLLCEDLPCEFAFDNCSRVPSVQRDALESDGLEQNSQVGAVSNPVAAFGQTLYGVVESLLSQFSPNLFVVSSGCPGSFLAMLRNYAEHRSGTVEVRPAREFQLALGLSSIDEATVLSRTATADQGTSDYVSHKEGSLTSLVILDARIATSKSTLSISSVGPLLSSVRGKRDIGTSLSLLSLCLDDYLFLDENTLQSLSVCSSDVHGFVHAKAGREGFSVLAMLSLTCSKFSQPLLRRWILMPLAKRAEIRRRHEAVELLMRQESTTEVIQIRSKLAEMGGLPQLCFLLNKGVGSASTWDKLLKTCNAVVSIRSALNTLRMTTSDMIRELREQLSVDPLRQLADMIHHIIDFDESKNEGQISVKAGVDTHLDELRDQYAGLPALLDRVAAELRSQPAFQSTTMLHVVYFPQIGYLIVVPGGEIVDMLADTSLEQQFASDEAVYLKNSRMTTMDQHLGDLASFIVDREIEILDGLQKLVGECSPTLLAAHAALSQLDCLIAFARAATLYDLRRPTLVEEQIIRLKGSRHALKALSDEGFVPNDIDLRGGVGYLSKSAEPECNTRADSIDEQSATGGSTSIGNINPGHAREADECARPEASADADVLQAIKIGDGEIDSAPQNQQPAEAIEKVENRSSVMVLTGANSSGKSCLLQQAALAVFLCQCGSFIPAAHAELGVFDKILSRMRQDESLASEGSSFTRELGRLHRAMSMSTKRSLVILDEVGRECRSDDGAGLFIATIYEFLQRGPECPIVVSATHHLRAIERHLPKSLPIHRAHMQTILLPTLANSYDSLIYLYRLKPGFAGTSYACHCARLCGVPESVVERADQICRVGLRAWHDSESLRDEQVVRRLLQLELGNDSTVEGRRRLKHEQNGIDNEAATKLLEWVLQASDEGAVSSDGEPE